MRTLLAFLLLQTSLSAAVVIEVVDGMTFKTLNGLTVKMEGVELPTSNQAICDRAKKRLEVYILERDVTLREPHNIDGITRAGVSWNGYSIDGTMVRSGFLRPVEGNDDERLQKWLTEAVRLKRGMWKSVVPQRAMTTSAPPWEWQQPATPRVVERAITPAPPRTVRQQVPFNMPEYMRGADGRLYRRQATGVEGSCVILPDGTKYCPNQ